MAEITSAGIQPDGLTGFVTRLEAAFKAALGDDLNVASETPQGQLIGELGIVLTEAEELAVHVANGLNINGIQGRQVTDWGTLLDLLKIAGERSTVTATLSGQPGTFVPAGSRARTSIAAVFATDAAATIAISGTVDVLMRAVEIGPIVASAGALTQIVDARAGWTGVTNTLAALPGRNVESDLEYRRRYGVEVAVNARDALEAVRARVRGAPGVIDALVRENTGSAILTVQGVAIDVGAILTVAEGGADADIAEAIAQTKPGGGPTSGNRSATWRHPEGFDVIVNFRRVDPVPIEVAITLAVTVDFPSDGLATMRRNLLDWFAGEWPVPGPGIFDQSGVGIGESIDLERFNTPLNAVPGHSLTTVTVTRKAGLLAGIAVTAGGTGYTSAPDVAVPGGSGATAIAVVANGAVVRVDITDRGDGTLTTAPGITFSGGGGTGAAATAAISAAALGTPNLDQRYTLDANDVALSLA